MGVGSGVSRQREVGEIVIDETGVEFVAGGILVDVRVVVADDFHREDIIAFVNEVQQFIR